MLDNEAGTQAAAEKAMAPERTGQHSLTSSVQKEIHQTKKPSTFLEDFLEIKIKEELEFQPEEVELEELRPEVAEEGEVVVYSECVKREEDHDLTPLSWLQSNNLLKSKPLKLAEQRKKQLTHEESPTSDLTEETESECSTSQSHSSRTSPQHVPMALEAFEAQDVALNEETRTEKYTGRHYGGKEKHHYSVPYDPQLHVNSKPPYSFSCLIFMAIEDSHARALPVKEIYSWITDHFPYFNKAPTGWKNSVRHNLSLNKCFRKVDKAPNLGKGSLWIVDPQYRPNLMNALSKAPYHPCATLDRSPKAPILPPITLSQQQQEFIQVKAQSRLPNPELFPYLSKRLAASEADRMNDAEDSDDDSLDDVDAATAMLELKHGQREQQGKQWRKRPRAAHDELKLLISTSPSEDHTYTVDRVKTYKQKQPVSPDEAYGGGSDSNDDNSELMEENEESWSSDGAEQRNVASALLHLAGGSRKRPAHTDATKSTRGRKLSRQPILHRTLKKASYRAGVAAAARREESGNNNSPTNTDRYTSTGRVTFKPKMTDFLVYSSSSR